MTLTLEELKEYLKSDANEDDLIDVLEISVEELVEAFDHKIDLHFEKTLTYFGLDEDDTDEL